jgi:hypothetical protein
MMTIDHFQGEIIVKMQKKYRKILKITSLPNSIKLGTNYPCVKGIQVSSNKGPGACFTKEITITIKFYPAHYSLIKANLKMALIVLKRI